jgi:hypothetical protein
VLVAPAVDLERGLAHRQSPQTLAEDRQQHGAHAVEGLVVHARGQHEVAEEFVAEACAPGEMIAGLEGEARTRNDQFRVLDEIPQRKRHEQVRDGLAQAGVKLRLGEPHHAGGASERARAGVDAGGVC